MNIKKMMNLSLALTTLASLNAFSALADVNSNQTAPFQECKSPQPQGLKNLVSARWTDDKFSNFYTYALEPSSNGLISVCPIVFENGLPTHFYVTVNLDSEVYGAPGYDQRKVLVTFPGKQLVQMNDEWAATLVDDFTQFGFDLAGMDQVLKPYKDAEQGLQGFLSIPFETTKMMNNETITVPFILNKIGNSNEFLEPITHQQNDLQPLGACIIGNFGGTTCIQETQQDCLEGIGSIWREGKCPAPDHTSPMFR